MPCDIEHCVEMEHCGNPPGFPDAGASEWRTAIDRSADQSNRSQEIGQRASAQLHPKVYVILFALVTLFALSVWSFAGSGITDYLLFIVSGFIFVVVALTGILSRVGHASDAAKAAPDRDRAPSFGEWRAREFETWQSHLSGAQAVVQILLPIAAAAFGMMAFGIAFVIVERGGV